MLHPGSALGRIGLPAAAARLRLSDGVAEEMANLWGRLFLSAPADRPKRLLITAADRREGTTQVACGMALAAGTQQRDHSFVLAELNVRYARVARLLGLRNVPGMAEVLIGVSSLDAALREVEGTALTVLPAGGPQTRPIGLFAGPTLEILLSELSERFDHVLIDAPPVNHHPEAQILAPLVDGVLLVVRSGCTCREAVDLAKRRLELARAKLLGVVLNDRVFPIPSFLYRRL